MIAARSEVSGSRRNLPRRSRPRSPRAGVTQSRNLASIWSSASAPSARPTGPLDAASGAAGPYHYEWSTDNGEELARGWLHKGDDVEQLAASAGIADPARAAQSVREYNDACAVQRDPLGRPADSLVPLDRPPYYCMPLWPGGPNTSGGPRRNERAEVVDVFGDPIPGLYAAGELGEGVGVPGRLVDPELRDDVAGRAPVVGGSL